MTTPNYPGNSKKKKESEEAEPRRADKKVERVVSGDVTQRKPPLSRRIAETFAGDDARSVGGYILFDVIIPAAKSMISDAVSQGIERMLFGTTTRSSSRSSRNRGSSGYHKMYNGRNFEGDGGRGDRDLSRRGRATHDFDEIVIETRGEAEEVLDMLGEIIEKYDVATVNDLYDLVGITGTFTDDKWGWVEMLDAHVRPVRGGYLLKLPKPEWLE